MKITLITPTYNSAKTLSDTIQSILSQNYTNIEYIIIDAQSTDETKSIVSSFQDKIQITFISEPDNGIYDAMNKGIKMATGDIVGILNSDDFYSNPQVLSDIVQAFESDSSIDAVYGDLIYVDKDNIQKQTRYWKTGEYKEKNLDWGWIIPHPSFFVKREVYTKNTRIFDTSLPIAADYELILRLLKIEKIKVKYVSKTLVHMRTGGESSSTVKQRINGWKQLSQAWKINSLNVPQFFIIKRVFSKISQFSKH